MTKNEFLEELGKRLSSLPQEDKNRSLEYYNEMITDRMEDGVAEEEAVLALGSLEDIVAQIVAETPMKNLVKEKLKKKRALRAWEIVLLAVGSPIWISLLLAFACVALAVYISLWAGIVCLWCVPVCCAACAPVGVLMSVSVGAQNGVGAGIFFFGASLLVAGIAVFAYFGCIYLTKAMVLLTKKLWLAIKYSFVKQEVKNGECD